MSRAIHFQEKRQLASKEVAEDYTEMILDLTVSQGKARVCDLAREMGISHVSVLKSLKKLVRDEYVKNTHPCLELTKKGKDLAIFAKARHETLLKVLLQIGVPERIAATDVEGIEHYISEETLQALKRLHQALVDIGYGEAHRF